MVRGGGEPERLAAGGAIATGPTISRKGGRLAYTQGLIRPNLWSIALSQNGRKVSGGPGQFLFSAAYNNGPQFSPDGKRLAFTSGRSGYNEIWTCDATDCSEPQQLTFLKVVSGMPRWSPDGKQIVFDSRPTGHSQVMMISAEGGSPVPLTDGKSEDKVPSWSSNGKFVYFSSNRSGAAQIWKTPRRSRRQTADIFTTPRRTNLGSGGCRLLAVMRFEYSPILLNIIGETGLCRSGEFIMFLTRARTRPLSLSILRASGCPESRS